MAKPLSLSLAKVFLKDEKLLAEVHVVTGKIQTIFNN